jgi:ferric-dicitrate binding protein FerR (iron transport regulator)
MSRGPDKPHDGEPSPSVETAQFDQELLTAWSSQQREAIAHWAQHDAPNRFSDEVVAKLSSASARNDKVQNAAGATGQELALSSPRQSFLSGARWSRPVKAIVAAALCIGTFVGVLALWSSGTVGAGTGKLAIVDERQSVAIGSRGIGVAEPGTSMEWQVDRAGAASVNQSSGNVFYRIEHGGPFVVHTPGGDVRVTGTCFRVEIAMKQSSKVLLAGAAGALLAGAVVVTVYEGGVVVAHGQSKTTISAGESATMPIQPSVNHPEVAAVNGQSGSGAPRAADVGAKVSTAAEVAAMTKDQLLAHESQQRDRIGALEDKLTKLESLLARKAGGDDADLGPHTDPEVLKEWAKECKVRVDYPVIEGLEPPVITAGGRFEEADVAGANIAMKEVHQRWLALVRGAYLEITGDQAAAKTLSIEAMGREIEDKGGKDEMAAIRARIANERAGLAPAPAAGTAMSATERYFRAFAALGDDTEAALAKQLGPERAKSIRGKRWDSLSMFAGCAD